jgi:hypothetical protein
VTQEVESKVIQNEPIIEPEQASPKNELQDSFKEDLEITNVNNTDIESLRTYFEKLKSIALQEKDHYDHFADKNIFTRDKITFEISKPVESDKMAISNFDICLSGNKK